MTYLADEAVLLLYRGFVTDRYKGHDGHHRHVSGWQ